MLDEGPVPVKVQCGDRQGMVGTAGRPGSGDWQGRKSSESNHEKSHQQCQALAQAFLILTPVLGGRFPCYHAILLDKESEAQRGYKVTQLMGGIYSTEPWSV